MSTMQEVAKRAGVSKATVSRVLSGKGYTSDETKELVYKAIEETGYRPNLLARNLATSKSQCIGLVVTNTLYAGSYFSELLSQAAKKLEANGRQLILVDGKHSAEEEKAAIDFLLDLRCDAVIIYPRFMSVDEMDALVEKHKQPIMVMNRKLRKNQSHCICCDHHGASFTATRHLIERGHRDIAFITGSMDSPTALDRLAGYKAALTASGHRSVRAHRDAEVGRVGPVGHYGRCEKRPLHVTSPQPWCTCRYGAARWQRVLQSAPRQRARQHVARRSERPSWCSVDRSQS